ncbi:hypothetical protein LCGC14_2619270 [marine sediment metagenome]|uniref:Uncharacterized protein n=1 Tax=marine sediment metagenome TaxID=412755 RepID=A0A0F9A3H9_9ZZZZ
MDLTTYSSKIPGDKGNYDWECSFDKTGKGGSVRGYLGITTFEGGTIKDRILLSPDQVQELAKFIKTRIRTSVY